MPKLKLFSKDFYSISLDIEPKTFAHHRAVSGFNSLSSSSYDSITFVLKDIEKTEDTVNQIRDVIKPFLLDPKQIEDHIFIRDKFKPWERDKRPRIVILLKSGYIKKVSAPQFTFENN